MTETLTVDDLDNLRHMLGVSARRPQGYRNYFVAAGPAVESMQRLSEAGFAVRGGTANDGVGVVYHATVEGARAVGLKGLTQ